MNKLNSKDKLSIALSTSCFLGLTVFLFTPLNVYLTNLDNFNFYTNAWVLLIHSLTISGLFIAISSLILISRKASKFKNLIAILFTLAFFIWFFGNILVWDYGLFCGIPIHWNDYNYRGIIDLVIYIFLLILLIFKKDSVYTLAKKTSIFLIIIQLISLALLAFTNKQKVSDNISQKLDYSQQFTFSKNKNIIILVLDTFQTDFFQEIISQDEFDKKIFNDFTYFRNATSGFPHTAFSTPLILTSKFYDNSQPKKTFLKNAFTSDSSISKILKENGFFADIYPDNLFYCDNQTISNYQQPLEYHQNKPVKLLRNKDILFDYIQLADITLFRICPHFLKKHIYANRSWFLKRILTLKKINYFFSKNKNEQDFKNNPTTAKPKLFSDNSLNDSNVKFINELSAKINVQYEKPAFKYYHLGGMHPPIYLDENLNYHPKALALTRESCLANAKALLKLTGMFIDILKKQGIYDNSLILIIGDHGTYNIQVNLKVSGYKETSNPPPLNDLNIGSGLPLILVKPFKSQTDFNISDVPVSLANIGATIFDQLNIPQENQTEKSMFKIDKDDKTSRRVFNHKWAKEEHTSKYLPVMTEYTISGFSWLSSSWKLKKKITGVNK
ncbi:MAG: LTA synthase family protein [Candidatus Omnitrophica bacterium]|nr:LTA synthase family protein [Candidatus Omnitrophota bacterium]